MNAQRILTGALGVQLVLAAITWWPSNDTVESRPVLPFAEDAITSITVHSTTTDAKDPEGLVLSREGEGWVIASEYGYPAATEKVDELVDKLAALKIRSPITLRGSSHEQLNVSDSNATRRVTVKAGDQEVSMLLGVAGNARSHLRLAGEDPVYLVPGFGAWSIRDNGSAYLETKLLDVMPGKLETFSLTNPAGTVNLVRDESHTWTAEGLPAGATLDPPKLDRLFRDTLKLTLTSPADPAIDPFAAEGNAVVRWSVDEDGQSVEHSYAMVETDGKAVIRLDSSDRPVTVGSSAAKKALLETTLESLMNAPAPAPRPAPAPEIPPLMPPTP